MNVSLHQGHGNIQRWSHVRKVAVLFRKIELELDDQEITVHTQDSPCIFIDEREDS